VDIGEEQEPYVTEPLEDPVPRGDPAPPDELPLREEPVEA
jgi:hypothetical protein